VDRALHRLAEVHFLVPHFQGFLCLLDDSIWLRLLHLVLLQQAIQGHLTGFIVLKNARDQEVSRKLGEFRESRFIFFEDRRVLFEVEELASCLEDPVFQLLVVGIVLVVAVELLRKAFCSLLLIKQGK